uniref:Endo-1,5-alpha-L-arabinanase A n=1 Tax=Ditylenchus dipsaci TaxID=166011 RepID=A0A915ED06_9BILA
MGYLSLVCFLATSLPSLSALSGDLALHDPSMILRPSSGNPKYLIYSSHEGLMAHQSSDRISWKRNSAAFPNGINWVTEYTQDRNNKALWHPTFPFMTTTIGVATSTTGLPGSFTDQGKVIVSNSSVIYNCIDPNLLVDASGKWWLQFGSFYAGIYQVELSPSTGKVKSGATPKRIASRPASDSPANAIEAPHLTEKAPITTCSYHLTIAAKVGPFVDKSGKQMLNGGGTQILATSGDRIGPGGQSVLADGGTDRLIHHYYDKSENGLAKLGVRTITWTSDGWLTV